MALARCLKCGKPHGKIHNYVAAAEPVGQDKTAAICGTKACEETAKIWLTAQEKAQYDQGLRVFRFPTFAMKVRVEGLALS